MARTLFFAAIFGTNRENEAAQVQDMDKAHEVNAMADTFSLKSIIPRSTFTDLAVIGLYSFNVRHKKLTLPNQQ